MTSRQARWAPPAAPLVTPRRASIRSRWPDWVGPAAAAWSLGYGLFGLWWTLGGAGFPFGTEHDPHAARVSILEHVQQEAAAPVIAALGLGGAALAMVLARRRTWGPVGAALLGFAWTMAVALTVVIPDQRPLMGIARTPIVLVGLPFGWPPGVTLSSLFPWPVVNQFLLIGGGLLWAAAGIAYQRRSRNACGHCGRTDATGGWTTPASAARWGRWATAVAVIVPVLYAVTRWAWALGIPLGVTREFLREEARDTPDIWLAGAALATLAVGGATLTLGLVQRWGEVYPHWIPFLGGKPVRPRTAILPASLVAVLMTSAGLGALPHGGPRLLPRRQHRRELGDRRPRLPVAAVGRRPGGRHPRLPPSPARPMPLLRPTRSEREVMAVLHIEVSTTVEASRPTVLDVYADYQRWPRLFPTIGGVRLLARQGPKLVLEVDHVEGKIHNELEVRPPDAIDLWEEKRHYDARFSNRFETVPGGTRFTVRGDIRLKGWARLLQPFLGGHVRRQIQRLQLQPVKAEAEARARQAAEAAMRNQGDLAGAE